MIRLPKTAEETSYYLPHSDNMCLIDEVISISELSISARTKSHQDKYNPLRFEGKLPVVSGVEYAAQTSALHLALQKIDNHYQKREGYLAAVQNCVMHIYYLDLITCLLDIDCKQVYVDSQCGTLYEFNITAGVNKVLTGQLIILFNQHDRHEIRL